jgi:hypothetical protein
MILSFFGIFKPVLQIVFRCIKYSSKSSSHLLTFSHFAVAGFIWKKKAAFSMHYKREKKEKVRFMSTKYAAFKLLNKTSFVIL